MTAFKEFAIGKFVLRFYKTDHVWTCTATEDMLDEVKKELALQKLSDIGQEIETLDTRSYLIGRYDGLRELTEDTDCQYCKQGCFRCDARKALTDEEIGRFKGQWYRGDFNSFYDLVQAILKKASEK